MNTIKTLVVVTTLLAIGYGAHVVLNKPIPNGQFAQDMSFPKLPGFDKPSLSIENEGPSVSLPPLQDSDAVGNRFARGSGATLPSPQLAPQPFSSQFETGPSVNGPLAAVPPVAGDTQGFQSRGTEFAGQSPATAADKLSDMVAGAAQSAANAGGQMVDQFTSQTQQAAAELNANAGNAISNLSATANQAISQSQAATHEFVQTAAGALVNQGSGTTNPAVGNPLANNLAATVEQGKAAIAGVIGGAVQSPIAGSQGRAYGTNGRFEETWTMAQSKLQSGQVVDALLTLSMYFNDATLSPAQRDQLVPLLDQLAGSVIYSNDVHVEAPYEVKPGETLQSVADSYGLTPNFLMRTNGLASPALQTGQRIKVIRGPFRAELSLARRELTLFAGRYYAGRFPVAIGRDLPPQVSILEVTELAGAKPYTDPRTGEQLDAGDGNNPYGSQWIGLRDAGSPSLTNLGLHSSGPMVDASDSRGCISLSSEDADDLQAILTSGSRIQIVP